MTNADVMNRSYNKRVFLQINLKTTSKIAYKHKNIITHKLSYSMIIQIEYVRLTKLLKYICQKRTKYKYFL